MPHDSADRAGWKAAGCWGLGGAATPSARNAGRRAVRDTLAEPTSKDAPRFGIALHQRPSGPAALAGRFRLFPHRRRSMTNVRMRNAKPVPFERERRFLPWLDLDSKSNGRSASLSKKRSKSKGRGQDRHAAPVMRLIPVLLRGGWQARWCAYFVGELCNNKRPPPRALHMALRMMRSVVTSLFRKRNAAHHELPEVPAPDGAR
jgi:hypothetical protein